MQHRPKSDSPGGELGTRAEGELEFEYQVVTRLEERARAMLEHVVGTGRADVRVGISLDSTTRERTEEHYEPAKTALRSEQRTEEHSTGEPERIAGVPGAGSNLPEGTGETNAAPANSVGTTRQNWTRNWEIDRVTEKMATPAGRVARLTVAALVDGSYRDGAAGREFVTRDRAELDRLGELVKGAVGFHADRGDFLQIECARFAVGEEPEPAKPTVAPAIPRRFVQYAIYGGAGLFVVMTVAITMATRRRRKLVTEVKRLELEAAAAAASATPAMLEGSADSPQLLTTPQKDPALVRTQALEIALNDPATAAIILRSWLNATAEPVPARL